ncbi:signal peptidase I [Arthrobacter sp. AET 35A]|uniref:signal peptidase I n=1 Tax=Arthrobacter sp. AET 35A TaxID=2292643 RepID=UPI00177A93D9|nr:signal peptidase I [Arthrobacter sp. AET 35A]MBE0011569.1 signal peptidase I [Arthrobacter sp. AET 35A]
MATSIPGKSNDDADARPDTPRPDAPRSEARAARRDGSSKKKGDDGDRGLLGWLKEILIIVGIAILLSFLIKTFLFRAFFIPSGSMENTLEIDDRIFVNQLVPAPFELQRGDVVVFQDTEGWLPAPPPGVGPGANWVKDGLIFVGLLPDDTQQHLVKRVIGMAGDRVVCCDDDGRITVNGEPLEEPYLYPGASPSDTEFDVTVPEGKIWVMGDHRNASADSRANTDKPNSGFIDVDDVEGKAAVIAWPLDRMGFLGNYPDVFDGVPEPAAASDSAS